MNSLQGAIELIRVGRRSEAELVCERLRHSDLDRFGALTLLAQLRMDAGRMTEAIPALLELRQMAPSDTANLRRLGGALLAAGRAADSEEVLAQAVRLEPGNVRGHNNLGQSLLQLRRFAEASACFAAAVELEPTYIIGRFNLGVSLEALGRPTEALRQYDRVVEQQADHHAAWARRGTVQWQLGRTEDALVSFDRALNLKVHDALTLTQRAGALCALERPAEALAASDRALVVTPRSIEVLQYRAAALSQLNRTEEARAALEQARTIDPTNAETWCNLAVAHQRLGDSESARLCYEEAARLQPASLTAHAGLLGSAIPPVPGSVTEATLGRDSFLRGILPFENWCDNHTWDEAQTWDLARQSYFYLSYHEESNKSVLQRLRARVVATLQEVSPSPSRMTAYSGSSRRIRLGVVSAHVFEHSVFRALTQGWLEQLDHGSFEVSLFHIGKREDSATAIARRHVARFEVGPQGLTEWARILRGAELDAVLFPEIGMDRNTLALASLRLSPRQLVGWGHPETSGLPTVDTFVSAEAFEPPDAHDHYSERLARLPGLGVYLQQEQCELANIDLETLGIRVESPWFICPGTPFKYHPAQDAVWVEIAREVPDSTLVFFEYERPALSARLRGRLEAAFHVAGLDPGRQLRWIPWQSRAQFASLLRLATAYLDTIGFSGFNTLMMAVEAGLPCVTLEGRFLRGRLGSGILRHLGLDELVAADARQYRNLAVRLGTDPAYRATARTRMIGAAPRAYRDLACVRALEDMLRQ